jgi:cyanophycin synthetase
VPRQSVLQIAANNADAEKTAIAAADKVGYPVVVKPMSRRKGLGISVDVKDAAGVRRAVTEALEYENSIIIESFISGDDHRLLIVGGKMIAAAKRISGHVIGDGRQSVSESVGEVNQDPRRGKGFEALLAHLELNS